MDWDNTLFIVDPDGYKGNIINTMDREGFVHFRANLTLDEYKKEKGNENLVALEWDEYETKYLNPWHDSLKTDWQEITKDRYWEMLEVLPPVRWHKFTGGDFFFISEATTGSLHSHFCQYHGRYYERMADIRDSYDQIMASIKSIKD